MSLLMKKNTRKNILHACLLLAVALAACSTTTPAELLTAIPQTQAATAAPGTQATAPAATLAAQETGTPSGSGPRMDQVIPRPTSVESAGGTYTLSDQAGIYVDGGGETALAVGQYLADKLKPATGYSLNVQAASGEPGRGSILLSLAGGNISLGDEGYELTITPELVKAEANTAAGLFYAAQTIRQLLPAEIDSDSVQAGPWVMGTGKIHDVPRFAWRGTMLDVARHFFAVRDVTRYIDLLAYYKINRLHLHLSDDQGWRIQINAWPNLTAHGGSLEVGGTPGGYYSQDDYTYIVNYAQKRFITIIPEIDMPGHVTAALASYAELNCNGQAPELFTGTVVGFSTLCIQKDVTFTFVEDVIAELAAITPGPYIHVGGDEAQATSVADYMTFMQRVQKIIQAQGKHMIGWEEIAQIRLSPDTLIQHWGSEEDFARQAMLEGKKTIMSPPNRTYMDMKYTASTPLGLDWAGLISVEKAYSWDPAALVNGVTDQYILGVEAPLWAETLQTLDDVEYMAFPRILGFAEIGWSAQKDRNWYEYKDRLAAQGPRLDELGVNYYKTPEVKWP
jgi:hexosaminidase